MRRRGVAPSGSATAVGEHGRHGRRRRRCPHRRRRPRPDRRRRCAPRRRPTAWSCRAPAGRAGADGPAPGRRRVAADVRLHGARRRRLARRGDRPRGPPARAAPSRARRRAWPRASATPAGVRTELVTIPVGGGCPSARPGAAVRGGGRLHPSGHRLLRRRLAARRAAVAAASPRRRPADRRSPVWDAVWPRSLRRTRRLHDYGLEVLLRLDQDGLATFFDSFFDLPVDVWAPYLRIDASPREVSRTMTALARRLPRGLRRRLLVVPRPGGS